MGQGNKQKYKNHNPLQLFLLSRFFDAVAREIKQVSPATTLDFGAGEGYFIEQLLNRKVQLGALTGLDIRPEAIAEARARHPHMRFEVADLLTWQPPDRGFSLVIASEVLEHLSTPDPYLKRLCELCKGKLLLTVPHEPFFRLANLLRGKNISRWGNDIEHVNLWSKKGFISFISKHVVVEKAYTIFPFTIVLATPIK